MLLLTYFKVVNIVQTQSIAIIIAARNISQAETNEDVTSMSYMGGPRMSFRAWKSIKIGISGGRARSAVSLMDSGLASSVTCSLQSKGRKSNLGFVTVFPRQRNFLKIVTEKNKICKEILRKFRKMCSNHLSQKSCQIKDNMA